MSLGDGGFPVRFFVLETAAPGKPPATYKMQVEDVDSSGMLVGAFLQSDGGPEAAMVGHWDEAQQSLKFVHFGSVRVGGPPVLAPVTNWTGQQFQFPPIRPEDLGYYILGTGSRLFGVPHSFYWFARQIIYG